MSGLVSLAEAIAELDLQRLCPQSYACPTSGEIECPCHGGFDTCCDHPACPSNT